MVVGADQRSHTASRLSSASLLKSLPSVGACLRFFAFGDYGEDGDSTRAVARAMATWVDGHGAANFILALGDNFYPNGVRSVTDESWRTKWEHVFLRDFPQLRVPWQAILGNHDYKGNFAAQLAFTSHARNPYGALWQLPQRNYSFRRTLADGTTVDFFGLDTSPVQWDTSRRGSPGYTGLDFRLRRDIALLQRRLSASEAHWKIVFGHHPMYCKSRGHRLEAACLRAPVAPSGRPGYNLEAVLASAGAHAYFAGHDHVLELHLASGGLVCAVSGAVARPGLYQGKDANAEVDWYDDLQRAGFVAVEVTRARLVVRFVDTHGQVLREHVRPAGAVPSKPASVRPSVEARRLHGDATQRSCCTVT